MLRVFYDNDRNVLKTWMFDSEPYSVEEMKLKLDVVGSNYKDFDVELTGSVESYEIDESLDLVVNYKEPVNKYNPDTLITWAMSQLFSEALIPHFAAFLDFANKANDSSKANFLAYAGAVGMTETANTIIAKAIELNANITEGE